MHPSKWSVARVLEFIGSLGLDHLKDQFQKNVVDGEQLLDLNYTDLEEDLEITNADEIQRLLTAIDYLRQTYKQRKRKSDSYSGSEDEGDDDGGNGHENGNDDLGHEMPLHPHQLYGYGYGGMPFQPSMYHPSLQPRPVTVATLNPQSPMPWTIKARVMSKSDMMNWGETTHFFTVDLQDATGHSIRAMMVNEVADKFAPIFIPDRVYILYSGGSTVKPTAQRYPHVTSEFEINVAMDAEAMYVGEDDEYKVGVPHPVAHGFHAAPPMHLAPLHSDPSGLLLNSPMPGPLGPLAHVPPLPLSVPHDAGVAWGDHHHDLVGHSHMPHHMHDSHHLVAQMPHAHLESAGGDLHHGDSESLDFISHPKRGHDSDSAGHPSGAHVHRVGRSAASPANSGHQRSGSNLGKHDSNSLKRRKVGSEDTRAPSEDGHVGSAGFMEDAVHMNGGDEHHTEQLLSSGKHVGNALAADSHDDGVPHVGHHVGRSHSDGTHPDADEHGDSMHYFS